ncbi:uncharacterized protein CXorf65 homolog [Rhopilema esculentum]|uniref:uncharacterized protein CXorf65 homolog n=1 Tax=Rhopilema esculentum TaxID=499914 RepID=UPI0031DD01B7|eukprot:gene15842-7169_t
MVFIVVSHGDRKETLFNANCMVATLLDSIKERCGLAKSASIDICSESGSMCHLEDHLRENGSKFVKEREKYILVRREKCDDNTIKYSSLLKGLQKSNPDLYGFIEGKAVEREEVTPQPLPELTERKKSIRPTDKKSSISSLKRKGRVNVKVF